jgi:hypothetical protein
MLFGDFIRYVFESAEDRPSDYGDGNTEEEIPS